MKQKLSLLLGAYYFFYFSLVGIYIIFIPKVLLDLGYSASEVGIIYAAAPLMRFILPFLFRRFIALTPRVYLLSLLLTFLATLLFLWAINNFWTLLLANMLFGAAMGVSLPYVETIALASLPQSQYGRVRLWGSLGFMAVALWLGKMLHSPKEAIYYLIASAFATLLFGAAIVLYDTTNHHPPHQNSNTDFSLGIYWAFWVSIFLMQVGFGGFYNFFTIYETEHNISLELVTWMWSFGVIAEILMLFFQAPLLQKNLAYIILFATLITALRWLILFLFPDSVVLTFASQSLHAISFALYHTAAITYIYSLYAQKKLAQQFFLGIAFGLGGAVGAILAGLFYGKYLFLIEALITILAAISLLVHIKQHKEA